MFICVKYVNSFVPVLDASSTHRRFRQFPSFPVRFLCLQGFLLHIVILFALPYFHSDCLILSVFVGEDAKARDSHKRI
jgi:hypothetical protein